MADHATPNLPSRDFETSSRFYAALGFIERWRDESWMIMKRGDLVLEFFPHPELDTKTSWFSCCLRLDDLDAFYELCKATGPLRNLHGPAAPSPAQGRAVGQAHGAFVDPDGTLIRLIQN